MFVTHRKRSLLVVVLMLSQAFLFNAIFFTYGLVLTKFYAVKPDDIGLHILPLAACNLLGPFLLGPLFDTLGRRKMIGGTFAIAAFLLVATALLFGFGLLNAFTQTLLWMAIFFVASSAACGAYLTASRSRGRPARSNWPAPSPSSPSGSTPRAARSRTSPRSCRPDRVPRRPTRDR